MSKKKKGIPIAADLPDGVEVTTEEEVTVPEIFKAFRNKLPDDYDSLVATKRKRVEAVLENLMHGQNIREACKNAECTAVNFLRMRRRYPEIQEVMDAIIDSRLQIVEDSLYRSAIGYEYETTEQHQEDVVNAKGKKVGGVKRRIVKKTVHVEPTAASQIFFLKNRSRGRWRSDHNITIESTHTERHELSVEVNIKKMVKGMSTAELRQVRDMNSMLVVAAQNAVSEVIEGDNPDAAK